MPEESLYTVSEVAERLKVHPVSVRRFIKEGRLRAVRLGSDNNRRVPVRIPASALTEFLEAWQ